MVDCKPITHTYNFKDIAGQVFGRLMVARELGKKNTSTMWRCICSCGRTKDVASSNLLRGLTKSCGCLKIRDLAGQRFGRLQVTKLASVSKNGARWLCKCRCGNTKEIRGNSIVSGVTKSCGCLNDQLRANLRGKPTHGMRQRSEYTIWAGMKARCTNPKATNFARYGARGIQICARWLRSFRHFFADVGPRPSKVHQLDRIDNEGHYEPGNVRWATATEQARNRRPRREKHI